MSVAALVIIIAMLAMVEGMLVAARASHGDPADRDWFIMASALVSMLAGSLLFCLGVAWWLGWLGPSPSLNFSLACREAAASAADRGWSWYCR